MIKSSSSSSPSSSSSSSPSSSSSQSSPLLSSSSSSSSSNHHQIIIKSSSNHHQTPLCIGINLIPSLHPGPCPLHPTFLAPRRAIAETRWGAEPVQVPELMLKTRVPRPRPRGCHWGVYGKGLMVRKCMEIVSALFEFKMGGGEMKLRECEGKSYDYCYW